MIGGLAGAGPAAVNLYLPALPDVASDLHASTSAAQLTLALFLVGAAAGQLIFGPLSDVFGRRRPLLAGMLIFAAASILCAVAPSLATLCIARLLQGAGAASGMVIGRSLVRDLFGLTDSARYYSRLMLISGVAPIAAPLIGALLLQVMSWHGIFVVTAVGGLALTAGAARWLPETLPRDARRSAEPIETFRTFGRLLRHRRFVGCVLTLAFTMGALVSYLSTATFVIQDGYGASPQLFGALYGVIAIATVTGGQINAHLLHRYGAAQLTAVGLGLLLIGSSALLAVALTGLGLAAVALCMVCMMSSWGFVQGNVVAIALAEHAPVAGSASALLGVAQYATGALIAPLAGLGSTDTALPLALVSISVGLAAAAAAGLLIFRDGRAAPIAAPEPVEFP